MTSREKFEAWWGGPRVQESFAERTFRNIAWDAWRASRDEEIELPQKCGSLNMVNGRVLRDAAHYDEAIDDCADAIRSAGFKVKGG